MIENEPKINPKSQKIDRTLSKILKNWLNMDRNSVWNHRKSIEHRQNHEKLIEHEPKINPKSPKIDRILSKIMKHWLKWTENHSKITEIRRLLISFRQVSEYLSVCVLYIQQIIKLLFLWYLSDFACSTGWFFGVLKIATFNRPLLNTRNHSHIMKIAT